LGKGEKIELRGFGNFKLKTRNPRKARNPRTGESVDVPAKKVLHFKPGKELRDMLNSDASGHSPE
jgi:integration host factor subunit beta